MTDLLDYINSFRRLQSGNGLVDISDTDEGLDIRVNLNKMDLEHLPERILSSVFSLRVDLKQGQSVVNLYDLTNCKILHLQTEYNSSVDILYGQNIEILDAHDLKIDNIRADDLSSLEEVFLTTSTINLLSDRINPSVSMINLYFTNELIEINLQQFSSLKRLKLVGAQYRSDEIQLKKIRFPSAEVVNIQMMMTNNLDLRQLANCRHLSLKKIKTYKNKHGEPVHGVNITWPKANRTEEQRKGNSINKIQVLELVSIEIRDKKLHITGKDFSQLIKFKYDYHLNTKIILESLPNLEEVRTSVARFIIGYELKLYLFNLPNLKQIRTGHRIQKYIWKCPVITEFGQNSIVYDKKPDLDTIF